MKREPVTPDTLLMAEGSRVKLATKLYVGNLPSNISSDQIRALFTQAGEVGEVKLARDRETRILKGFAFVAMATEAGNAEAIKRFNGYSMGENALQVREARLRPRNLRGGQAGKNPAQGSEKQ
jgi:RNA recognition motif-containing protein